MLPPYLDARVEQRNSLTYVGVYRTSFAALELIAASTHKPQILSRRWPAGRFRQNVVNNQIGRCDEF